MAQKHKKSDTPGLALGSQSNAGLISRLLSSRPLAPPATLRLPASLRSCQFLLPCTGVRRMRLTPGLEESSLALPGRSFDRFDATFAAMYRHVPQVSESYF